jgi:hypothetical protein
MKGPTRPGPIRDGGRGESGPYDHSITQLSSVHKKAPQLHADPEPLRCLPVYPRVEGIQRYYSENVLRSSFLFILPTLVLGMASMIFT